MWLLQVNEGLSDSPADLLDFSMKQELEQVICMYTLVLHFAPKLFFDSWHVLAGPFSPAYLIGTCDKYT